MKLTKEDAVKLIKNSKENWYTNPTSRFEIADSLLNLRFLNNDQWIEFDKSNSQIVVQPYTQNIRRVTANYMLPYHESVKRRILSLNPRARAVPMTRDWSDYTLGLDYTKFFRGIFSTIEFEDYLQDMTDAMLVCGGCWIRPFWNKEIKQGNYQGEVDIEVDTDITSYIDPLATKYKDIRYKIDFSIVSKEWVNSKYNKTLNKDDLDSELGGWLLRIFSEIKKTNHFSSKQSKLEINDALVMSKLIYRDDKKTKVMLSVKDIILEEYEIPHFPIYIPFYKNNFSWRGRTPLSSLRGIQREINESLTRFKAESRKVPKLIKDIDIEFSDDRTTFDMDSSEIVEINFLRPNAYLDIVQPPPPSAQDPLVWKDQWSEVGGLSASSRGHIPTSQASGVVVDRLIDQDETKIGNAQINLTVGLRKGFKQIKELTDIHYSDDRAVSIVGRKRAWQGEAFGRFKKRSAFFDIDIEIGSALPTTQNAKIGAVSQLLQMGVFGDLPNPAKHARELMDLSVHELDVIDVDSDRQEVEIEQLIKGETPAAQQFDDHIKHIQVLLPFIKTKDFDVLTDKKKALVFAHLGSHQQYVQNMMKQQATNTGNNPKQEKATEAIARK